MIMVSIIYILKYNCNNYKNENIILGGKRILGKAIIEKLLKIKKLNYML